MSSKFKSDLSLAKGMGSAKSGYSHWFLQRFTAIILCVCTIWIIFFTYQLSGKDFYDKVSVAILPYNIVMITLFVIFAFYHAALGMQVIIEDYVSCRIFKIIMILCVQIFCIVTVIFFLLAAISLINL